MTFLVNLMLSRLHKFDGTIFGGGGAYIRMLIGLHICRAYIRGGGGGL